MARSGARTLSPQIARRLAGQRMNRGSSRSLADPLPDMLTMQHAGEIARTAVPGKRIYALLRSYQQHLDDPPPALKIVRDGVAEKIVDRYALAGGVYEQVLAGLRGANNDPFVVRLINDKPDVWHRREGLDDERHACGAAIEGNRSLLEQMTFHVDLLRRHQIWEAKDSWCAACRAEIESRLNAFSGESDQGIRERLTELVVGQLSNALSAVDEDPTTLLLEPVPAFLAAEITANTGNRPTDWLRHCARNDAFYNAAIEVYKSRPGGPTAMKAWQRHAAAEAAVSRLVREPQPVDLYALLEQEILPALILESWLEVLAVFPQYLERHDLSEHKHILNSSVTFAFRKIAATQHIHDGKICFISPAGHVLPIPEPLLNGYF